jgi:putative membrane-bound dehydrogenase-like protein
LQQEIGLGDAASITAVEIRWPGSGTVQTLTALELDKCYRVWEDAKSAEPVTLKTFLSAYPKHLKRIIIIAETRSPTCAVEDERRSGYKNVMKPRPWKALAFSFAALAALCSATEGPGAVPSPAEALKRMRVADGFEVKLVASEPHIRQPVTMSFDARGRIWIVQYLQYPNPAGLTAVSVDQYLRTKYDRVPEPPPRGPKGADKITICEDTDGDGVADKFIDFVAGLNLASGMALGYGGVFIAQPPYLLFYADKNHDAVPDGDPEVLLSGFGMEDSHAFANSLTWGPDGWLYGAHGSTVNANIRGIEFQQGIWRYHPVTREFELFAEGGGNTWGLDFNEEGEIIAGTNFGEKIGLHQVQGAYYVKGFAKHGPLHNPHTYGYFEHIPFKGFKGGHVTCGGIVYQSGAFPEQFNGAYVAANLLSSAIYWHKLERDGSSWKGSFGGALLETDDSTFRPIDCTTGPDGALYVVDWCDPRATHVDSVDNWDKTSGRIYRVRNAERGMWNGEKIDLAKLTSNQLVDQLTNHNDWFRRSARQLLAERRDAIALPRLRDQTLQRTNAALALQSLWALYVSGGFDDAAATKLLKHSHTPVRAWTIRFIGDTRKASPEIQSQIVALARDEKNAPVRNQLACSAKRWPASTAMPVIRELLKHDEDVNDPQIPLLLWWAIEDKAVSDQREVMSLLTNLADWNQPLIHAHILERLARRYASVASPSARQASAWLLTTAPTKEHRDAVLRGLDKAWEGQRAETGANEVRQALASVWSQNDPLMLRVGLRVALPEAEKRAIELVGDKTFADSERAALGETLGQCAVSSAMPALLQLLSDKPRLQSAAVSALQNFDDAKIASAFIANYPKLSTEARTRVRTALASRVSWAAEFVRAVETGKIDAKELSPDVLRQMLRHNDASLTAAIEKRWGKLQVQSSAEKINAINRLKLVLNPSGTTLRFKGDAAEGKKLFTQMCATCHQLFGEGNTTGPELTGADRKNTAWLLTQIVDPSEFIRPEYVNHNVEMKDGRSLTGLIVEQSDSALTVLDAQNQRTVLNRADMKEVTASATSLMPEGLLEALTPQQVRDLFSYLQSDTNASK